MDDVTGKKRQVAAFVLKQRHLRKRIAGADSLLHTHQPVHGPGSHTVSCDLVSFKPVFEPWPLVELGCSDGAIVCTHTQKHTLWPLWLIEWPGQEVQGFTLRERSHEYFCFIWTSHAEVVGRTERVWEPIATGTEYLPS